VQETRPACAICASGAGGVAAAPADPKRAQRNIAAEPRRDYVKDPKGSVFALPGGFGGLNGTVMVPTDHPVRPGDAIYVLERFF
jgi:hypothetical protein